jgi:hypothetical protein
MFTYYQVFAHVYPAQCDRVLVHSHIIRVVAPKLPEPFHSSFGNFFTLKRFFKTREKAEIWALGLHQKYAKGPIKNPSLDGGQLHLFQEV